MYSAARALRILRLIERSPKGRQLREVSARLDLPKPTALRLLRTLTAEGVVLLDPATGRYYLSPAPWLSIDPFLGPARSLIAAVQAVLGKLAEQTGATASIAMPDETGDDTYPVMSAGGAVPPELAAGDEKAAGSAGPTRGACRLAVPLLGPDGEVAGDVELAAGGDGLDGERRAEWTCLLGDSAGLICHMVSDPSWQAHAAAVPVGRWQLATPWDTPDPDFAEGPAVLVRSVSRAVRLMVALTEAPNGASLREVMVRRELDRSAADRLLRTLAWAGVVRREPSSGRYRISSLFWLQVSSVLRSAACLAAATARVLRDVACKAGGTACLTMLDTAGDTAVTVQYELPLRGLCYHPVTGQRHVLHASAAGKCLLAHRSSLQVKEYMRGGLRRLTESTVASPDRLARELAGVRRRGYAVSRQEAVRGLGGVALPIVGLGGEVSASLTLVPLAEEITEASIRTWLPTLRAAASSLSQVLASRWREQG